MAKIPVVVGFAEGAEISYEEAFKIIMVNGTTEADLIGLDAAGGRASGRAHKRRQGADSNKFKRSHTGFGNSFQNGREKAIEQIQNKYQGKVM